MSKHRLYFELIASNENFLEFLWIRSYVWIIPLSNRYIQCSFLGFELSLCFITSLPGNTSLTFVTSDSQFSCKQISTKSLVTTTSHSMKSAPSSIASCKRKCSCFKVHLPSTKANGKANFILWSLLLFNVNIKLDSLWTHLEGNSLSLTLFPWCSSKFKRTGAMINVSCFLVTFLPNY